MRMLFSKFERVYTLFLIILCAIVSILGIYQVAARYLFGWPIFWTEECIRYIYIATVMLGIGLASEKNAYTTITLFSDYVQNHSKIGWKVLLIFQRLVQIVFFGLLCFWGFRLVALAGDALSPATRIPFVYVYLPIPIGGLLGFLVECSKLYRIIRGHGNTQEVDEGIAL